MMEQVIRRGEELAMAEQRRHVAKLASAMKDVVGGARVEIESGRVLVRGRGLIQRWLTDPAFRFLSSALK